LSFFFRRGSEGEDVLLKEALVNSIFKVLMEGLTFGSMAPLAIIEGAIFFRSMKGGIIWYRLWVLDPGLILDSSEDVLDGELQLSGVLTHLEGLKWIRQRLQECLLLISALPPASVPSG